MINFQIIANKLFFNNCYLYLLIIFIISSIFLYFNINLIYFSRIDDGWMLLKDPIYNGNLNLAKIGAVFSQIKSNQYSPLNTIYYLIIIKIHGLDSFYFHLYSIILHVINGLLFFKLSLLILSSFNILNSKEISLIVSVIWFVLPINIEAVVWISASKVLLYSLFSLLSFICFYNTTIKGNKISITAILFFTLACFSKEQAVMNFFILMVFFLSARKDISLNFLLLLLPYLIISISFGILTLYINIYSKVSHIYIEYPFSKRFFLSAYCIFSYLWKTIIPINLHYNYQFPITPDQRLPIRYYIIFLLVSIMFYWSLAYLRKSEIRNFFYMCLGFIIINLLLVIQIFPLLRISLMADRFMYMASFFLVLPIITFCFINLKLKNKKIKYISLSVLTILLMWYTIYSHILANNWIHKNIL